MKKMKKMKALPCFRRWTRTPYAVFNSLNIVVKIGVLGAAMLTASNQPVLSQAYQKTDNNSAVQLQEVQVNSDLPPTTQQLVKVVAVLTRKDIEQAAVQDLQGLLNYVQGIDLRTRGTDNVQADISLRGGTFDQTAVLLNGVNLTDPQTGHFDLDIPIDIHLIERIEILYGPGAWTAGSISFSGAIDIITRQVFPTSLFAHLSTGAHNYQQTDAYGFVNSGKWRIAAGINGTQSSGYAPNTDFRIFNAYSNIRYLTQHSGQWMMQLGAQSKDFGANSFYSPSFPDQYEQTRTLIASLQYKKQWQHWLLSANAYYRRHHDMFTLFRYPDQDTLLFIGPNYHLTDIFGASLQASYSWIAGTTTLAGDLRSEHIFSNALGNPLPHPVYDPYSGKDVFTRGALRQYASFSLKQVKNINKWTLGAGILGSGNNDFGFHVYAGGNVDYAFTQNITLGFWLHNSYRLPTFTDLYYTSPTQIGNAQLKPEEAFNTDVHLLWTPRNWTIRAAFFQRDGHRIIDWVRLPSETVWHSQNLTNVQSMGTELAIDYRPQLPWVKTIHVDYTYLDVTKSSSNYVSLYATDYLRNELRIRLVNPIWKSLEAAWQLSYHDRAGTYLDATTNQETPFNPYWLCDLKLMWERPGYQISAEADNLFNTTYFDYGNLPQPRRWIKVGLTVKI
ncbi:TonB-dependent receptor [Microbacter margulisiae]|uniref:Iron complex outermembrane receptor protein n=1 Tax=Microbacter margulisiae TaxID=1350067 RepID=A0A7W5H2M4_9PORP|nr:TonB-dependent receptor [Microbacter margulisiae]MBB3187596.1 iron complex outermembrane receptor protein [Microbacter margulisiae]